MSSNTSYPYVWTTFIAYNAYSAYPALYAYDFIASTNPDYNEAPKATPVAKITGNPAKRIHVNSQPQ